MSDLEMYKAYVSDDVIDPLYKNNYRGYIPAFNQFVNKYDKLIMTDIEHEHALKVHAQHISMLHAANLRLTSKIESQAAKIESQAAKIESQDAKIESQDAKIESQDATINRLVAFINERFPDADI